LAQKRGEEITRGGAMDGVRYYTLIELMSVKALGAEITTPNKDIRLETIIYGDPVPIM
jgi:hypothetical protein